MFGTLKLGRAFGIGMYVHWTFWLLPLLTFWGALAGGVPFALTMTGVIVALFGCILLHELGHCLMARQFGIDTKDITLTPLGGVARLEGLGRRPFEEVWIALAGPAVNVVIATALAAGLLLGGWPVLLMPGESYTLTEMFLAYLLWGNVSLTVFNMLPAFPLDGGRVLRAVLEMGFGRVRATEIAAWVATPLALLLGLLGLFGENVMLVLVAGFIWLVGQQELMAVREQARGGAGHRGDAIDAAALPDSAHFTGYTWDPRHRVWVVWRDGTPVGVAGR